MRIATWNVNSIRTREIRVRDWLEANQPDLLCLQELKCTAEQFPRQAFESLGYHAAVAGQKTYNGVAILSKSPPDDVVIGLGDDVDAPQARAIAANFGNLRVMSVYVPNGSEIGSEKFAYKLAWLGRLAEMLRCDTDPEQRMLICGDTNVILRDSDAKEPEKWHDSVLACPEVREALGAVLDWGLVDLGAEHFPDGGVFSWWDYRRLAFPRDDGARIDHILATRCLAAECTGVEIDRQQRKGEKPSDHVPVTAIFE